MENRDPMADVYDRIATAVTALADELTAVSLDLHSHPELAMAEEYAVERLTGVGDVPDRKSVG